MIISGFIFFPRRYYYPTVVGLIFYINPNDKNLAAKVRAIDQFAQVTREESGVLPPRGIFFSMDNKGKAIFGVENESCTYIMRPYILKYYGTHIDIFQS